MNSFLFISCKIVRNLDQTIVQMMISWVTVRNSSNAEVNLSIDASASVAANSLLKCWRALFFMLFDQRKSWQRLSLQIRSSNPSRVGFVDIAVVVENSMHLWFWVQQLNKTSSSVKSRKAVTKEEEEEDNHERSRMMKFTIQFLFGLLNFLNFEVFCCLLKAILHNVSGRNHTLTHTNAYIHLYACAPAGQGTW